MKVAIVGLGYVGLPLAIQFARSNVEVIGLDIDVVKVDLINKGHSYIKHVESWTVEELVKQKKLRAFSDFSEAKQAEAVIICVPTPLNKNREPDISRLAGPSRRI
jgi:UDP-N-acetyl-D-glucosamine dehydrogenase